MILLVFIILTLRPGVVWALNITFPTPPTAPQNNLFFWQREQFDPNDRVWLRLQKLDDPSGTTSWSDNAVELDLTAPGGNASLDFNRTGLFNIGVFTENDHPNNGRLPTEALQFTVSANPTSDGAIVPSSTTNTSSKVSQLLPSTSAYGVSVQLVFSPGTITAITVGVSVALIVAGVLVGIRYRRKKASLSRSLEDPDGKPAHITPFTSSAFSTRETEKDPLVRSPDSPSNSSEETSDNTLNSPGNTQVNVPGCEIIQHEDSGLRLPPTPTSKSDYSRPVELPPSYTFF